MTDQTFRHRSCSDPACPTYSEIFTYAPKQLCSDSRKTSKEQERKFKTHSKLYVCLLLMVLMDDCCIDGWSLSLYALIKTLSLMRSLWCVSTEISLALCLKVCVFPVSDPATISCLNTFPKHIQWNVLCAPSKLLAFIHQYWKRKTLLHVNRRIPLVFRAALVLYLDY